MYDKRLKNHWAQLTTWCLNRQKFFFKKKWANPGLFFVYFWSFETNIDTIFTTNQCEKWTSSIRRQDSNPQPYEHESSPITTRPELWTNKSGVQRRELTISIDKIADHCGIYLTCKGILSQNSLNGFYTEKKTRLFVIKCREIRMKRNTLNSVWFCLKMTFHQAW